MKKQFTLLIFCFLFLSKFAFTQTEFLFFQGTWQMEGKEIFERWDMLNNTTMKGIAYTIHEGQVVVFEYLDVLYDNNEFVYMATVPDQNQGKSIVFKITAKTDDTFTFENPEHDFPKKIVYQKLNETELFVQISGDDQQGFSYKLIKQ